MVLSESIQDCSQFARHELGHSANTYHAYVSWQRNFACWLAEEGMPDPPVQQVTSSLIGRFSYSLSKRGLRPRTVRGALHALRALFSYLVEMDALPTNPALKVRLPKMDAAVRLLVTDDDLLKLLEAAERQGSDFRCVRDRAMLSVLIHCGLRRQELLDLTVDGGVHQPPGSVPARPAREGREVPEDPALRGGGDRLPGVTRGAAVEEDSPRLPVHRRGGTAVR